MVQNTLRAVPMEVVCLGLCRTGTQTLADSLEVLGYGSIFHMREVVRSEGPESFAFWTRRMKALNDGDRDNLPTRADLDTQLGKYGGICDLPGAVFIDELLDAYPDAKVIMTTRSEDSWIKSMNSSINHAWNAGGNQLGPFMQELGVEIQRLWDDDFEANGRKFFQAHHQRAREAVAQRGRKMLEFDVSKEGSWQELCAYLGKSVPAEMTTFPHSDAWGTYRKAHGLNGLEKDEDQKQKWDAMMELVGKGNETLGATR